jgi:hypothetical protein
MNHTPRPGTTHTVEMSQLAELNNRLSEHQSGPRVTASELGLAGARMLSGRADGGLPGSAVLARLGWEGPADFPYVHGHFGVVGQKASLVVELHTAALGELGRRFGVRQQWGF